MTDFFTVLICKVTISGTLKEYEAILSKASIARIAPEPIYAQTANVFTKQMEIREIEPPSDDWTTVTTHQNTQFFALKTGLYIAGFEVLDKKD